MKAEGADEVLNYRYTIPFIPPSNNQYIGRTNFREYQKTKKEWAHLIQFLCNPKPREPIQKAVISLTYFFPDRRRRDPDNFSGKMILDGLVRAGILADDSFHNITLKLKAEVDKEKTRTVIEVAVLEY